MKPVLYSIYKIPARRIAELVWGKGGTTAYKTNRVGAYYYSCSSHGGYVVDHRALSEEELSNINKYITPSNLMLLVQNINGKLFVIGENLGHIEYVRPRRYKYNPSYGPAEWVNHPVYLFEEDCNWSALELHTNIRAGGLSMDEEKRMTIAREAFDRWVAGSKLA